MDPIALSHDTLYTPSDLMVDYFVGMQDNRQLMPFSVQELSGCDNLLDWIY